MKQLASRETTVRQFDILLILLSFSLISPLMAAQTTLSGKLKDILKYLSL